MHPKRPLIIHYPKPIPFDVLCNYFDKCDVEDNLRKVQFADSESTGQDIKFKSEKWIEDKVVTMSLTQIIELEEIKRQTEIKQEKFKQEIKRQEEIKQEIKRQTEIKKRESRFKSTSGGGGGWTTVQSKNKW